MEGELQSPKGITKKIIVALMCAKRSLRNVSLFHMNLMVSRVKIQFGEILGSIKLIQKIIYDWDRERILDGNLIKFSKIRAHPPIAFFL